jgi:signal transduction histidine kinase
VNHATAAQTPKVVAFRTKLLVAMMLVVSAITALALYFSERNAAAAVERDLRREFHNELTSLHNIQEIRLAALVERCRALVGKSRIHAALEDGALDLLYPSAKDELRDVMEEPGSTSADLSSHALHAQFYRFLDANGAVISPPNPMEVGELRPEEETELAQKNVPQRQQIGYLVTRSGEGERVLEVIAMPIFSTENGEVIAALVLGFKSFGFGGRNLGLEIRRGLWLGGRLILPSLDESTRASVSTQLQQSIPGSESKENSFTVKIGGIPHLLFHKRLNPDSQFPAAYEVCVYPLTELLARQKQLRWQVLSAGAFLLLGALGLSHYLAGRLSKPVEKLSVDSEENRTQRVRAEAALELTHEELQRAARFSADASHQLKTPVTVLRAGLEELLARNHLPAAEQEEISALIHETYRLAGIIEDLLLLSRMDAGRLQLNLSPVNLSQLIEGWLDDIGAFPDDLGLKVQTDFLAQLHIAGEKRYTSIILQNLLENARKYNRPGGVIRISAHEEDGRVSLTVGNTGRSIPMEAQIHIFERFHRGSAGGNVPGHGLGLNLARELARLHGGELRLLRSADDWTEFEVRFRAAKPANAPTLQPA